jgi:hypothetical protein
MTSREHFAQFDTLLRLVTSSPATVGPAQTFVVAFAKCFFCFFGLCERVRSQRGFGGLVRFYGR